ncbi:serine/threonine-protein kinase Nek4-like isoform X2 [Dysidea avara]|uniref:serine/threonine-protein kinase Nek4-like isoform X2 n=1 Tax=Dysidea avara TaxID=196820 RepID=UPI0033307572
MSADKKPVVGHYVVYKLIGKGSYGQVYLVRSKRDKRQYVMKNISLDSLSDGKERAAALLEAQLLSSMAHPNIVAYKESFQDSSGTLHIVMAYCEGGDLSSRLKAQKGIPLPEDQVIEWFVQTTLALQYLHERHILHRDLKTSNIFLSKNDIVKVGDLGIARVLEGSCDLAHTVIGTPFFMSPELFNNQPYSYKSDVWSLGCCVYEMASLKHAFSATSIHALMAQVVQGKLPTMPHRYSNELCDLIRSMLSHDAEQRPSVNQLLRLPFVKHNIRLFLERATSRKSDKSKSTTKDNGSFDPKHKETSQGKPQDLINHVNPVHRVSSVDHVSITDESPKLSQPHPPISMVISKAREKRRRTKQAAAASKIHGSCDPSDVMEKDGGVSFSHVSDDVTDGGDHVSSGAEKELDSFLTLLDDTLHLPPVAREVTDTPSNTAVGHVSMRLGRLEDRIVRLRRELVAGIGHEMFYKAHHLLDTGSGDLEEAEQQLQQLIGLDLFTQFGTKLQELKFCEETSTSKT